MPQFTTFDIIGHLAFAEPFNCLSSSDYHPWVTMIFSTIKFVTYSRALNRVKDKLSETLIGLLPKRIVEEHKSTFEMAHLKLLRRKEKRPDYTDFMTHLIAAEEKGTLVAEDLASNAPVFVVAGSETTATLLSGTTYLLLKNQRTYLMLAQEIRSAFAEPGDITLARAGELKYLSAVIDESLRLYPPGANNHPRLLPPQGAIVAGEYVPGGSMVGINHYAIFRSPFNFRKPEEFIPERFLPSDNQQWANDKREALQPFSYGSRNCIGRK